MKAFLKLGVGTLLIFTLVGCASSMNAVWQKEAYKARPYQKMAVVAISKNLETRQSLESAMISEIKKNNPEIELVSGLELLPPNASKDKWKEEAIETLLKKYDIDAVLTTSMVDNYTTEDMTSTGNSIYFPRYYRVGRYVYRTYGYMYTPPTYDTTETFVLQSNLFDLKEGYTKEDVLVWQGQSNVVNPTSIYGASKKFAKNLIVYFNENSYF